MQVDISLYVIIFQNKCLYSISAVTRNFDVNLTGCVTTEQISYTQKQAQNLDGNLLDWTSYY